MQALVFDGHLDYRADHPDSAATPGESVVRVHLAGICGTDLELTRGYMAFRGVPGHEFVGEVIESADRAMLGRRVAGEINAGCGRAGCRWCGGAMARHCPDRTVLGILGRDGAFAAMLRLPDENLIPVPDSISDELAVFIEPLAAAYEIFEQAHLRRDRTIAVLGDGRLGATVALALRAEGYVAIVLGRHREKLDRLAALGLDAQLESDFAGRLEVVVDCTGKSAGLRRALELVRPRGTIILKSTAAAGAALNLAPMVINEITVIGSRCGRFAPAIAAMEAGRIDLRPLIDGTFVLDDWRRAFAAAENSATFKILLRPS
ncbi:MAG TPA: alcohol dehydrogenase catalytic domain-containing protein [Candidatus Binataceae bacterium]|nr:alcohol dehydrogenase catalytic domain-containing protein [Candidatus Binataceae bacterium]